MILMVHKNKYETMGKLLERLRVEGVLSASEKATYAGRLDPMASGLCMILSGEHRFEKEKYLGNDKVYEIKILLGVSTDTGDLLGVPVSTKRAEKESLAKLDLKKFIGKREQEFPAYSSSPVDGKPLWVWAKKGVTKKRSKQIEVYEISAGNIEQIFSRDILDIVKDASEQVFGDFRQEEILRAWNDLKFLKEEEKFWVLPLTVYCSSGTYMRVLAQEIGEKLCGAPALAMSIIRIKIGDHE
jgi:tRNA pseudouridine55 synthase